jgi:nucleoid DNA-binding protein
MEDMQFELVASSLRADAADLDAFVEALAVKLEDALPGRTRVERRSAGLFSRSKRVHRISVDMESGRYDLVAERGRVQVSRGNIVRGIVLKTEPLSLDTWIDELSRELTQEADRSEQGRVALQRLLGA